MSKPLPAPEAGREPDLPRGLSIGRMIGITLFGLVAGVTVIALIAAGFVVWTIQRSFPQLEGSISVEGLEREVAVQRDVLGIPTLTASDSGDLFFAQGYVHAQDRFWEMDFRRHVTSGRLSELFGESQLGTDKFLRTLGWREVAAQEVEALDPTIASYYEAYANGVNAYLADHTGADASFEYAVLGLQNPGYAIEPWTPEDSVAWLKAMAWDLRANLEDETERAILASSLGSAEIDALYPGYPFDRHPVIVPTLTEPQPARSPVTAADDAAPASVEWSEVDGVLEAVGALLGDPGEGIGSNSWVVSGDLTESGMPLLANDPHLGAELPSVWHQIGLRCGVITESCPFDVAGFSFSGVPGVVIGHNARIAWGFTNLTTDVADLYIERVQGDQYWRDGQLLPIQERTETIEVAGGEDVPLIIRSTGNGPLVSGLTPDFDAIAADPYTGTGGVIAAPTGAPEGEYAVSLRWTALEPGTTAASIFALNRAADFEEFQAAADLFDVPAQNLIYADVDGNIGYQTPGSLPIRGAGDGSMPQPGWDSAYDWQGYIPFEELPTSYNPPEGFIVTANNAVAPEDYPYFLTADWDYGWRAGRIIDLLQRKAAAGSLTVEDMRDIQADQEFAIGKNLVAAYMDVSTGRRGPDAALDLLRGWDAQNDADSGAAAYANVLWDELALDLFVRGRDAPAPVTGQGRLFLVVSDLLNNPASEWWANPELGVSDQGEMLEYAADAAYDRLVALQGDNPAKWEWGRLHALNLTSGTFGASGIPPLEMLFNRGPYPVGGGSSVIDATGWNIGISFETITVPSMRMVVDLSDLDASRWNNLTGTSGHTFHPNYVDQVESWRRAELTPWAFTDDAVDAATTHTLTLTPED